MSSGFLQNHAYKMPFKLLFEKFLPFYYEILGECNLIADVMIIK